MTDQHPTVAGYCPSCGGESLFLGAGGYVTCRRLDCDRPDAAASILEDRETEHIFTFGPAGFTIRHPLRERLDGVLEDCPLHRYVVGLDGPPITAGRYRARLRGPDWTDWSWEALPRGTCMGCGHSSPCDCTGCPCAERRGR